MNVNGINSSAEVKKAKNSSPKKQSVKLENKPDTFTFNGNVCSENVQRVKTNLLGFNTQQYSYTGMINNKPVVIESEEKYFQRQKEVHGKINDKNIDYVSDYSGIFNTKASYLGKYGENYFDLEFDYSFARQGKISGTINDKDVSINFPGSEVPEDEVTRDIVTTLLTVDGKKPVSHNNKFSYLRNSEWQQKLINQQQMAATNLYIYDSILYNPTAPKYY